MLRRQWCHFNPMSAMDLRLAEKLQQPLHSPLRPEGVGRYCSCLQEGRFWAVLSHYQFRQWFWTSPPGAFVLDGSKPTEPPV